MKALIFNGALERRSQSTSGTISLYLEEKLKEYGIESTVFNLDESGIPLFDITLTRTPKGAEIMNSLFREADIHFWLAPLYHGSIPGVMKNCIDWLEISSKSNPPYLTDKTIGLICWADGVQAMQGINTMDAIAKSLRAWPLPFNVPITRNLLFTEGNSYQISQTYKNKLDLLVQIAATKTVVSNPLVNKLS